MREGALFLLFLIALIKCGFVRSGEGIFPGMILFRIDGSKGGEVISAALLEEPLFGGAVLGPGADAAAISCAGKIAGSAGDLVGVVEQRESFSEIAPGQFSLSPFLHVGSIEGGPAGKRQIIRSIAGVVAAEDDFGLLVALLFTQGLGEDAGGEELAGICLQDMSQHFFVVLPVRGGGGGE